MKILVCISKVPDTTSKISFTDNNTKFNEEGVQYIVNPSDEWYALVRGLELKEANGGSVTTITVGGQEDEPVIRKALAIGADEAVRVDAQPTDAFFVADQIAAYAKGKEFDLVLGGEETINYNGGQVPGMVAELMGIPFVCNANSLEMKGNKGTLEHAIQGGSKVVECEAPFVVSCSKGMAEQRIPNMRGIMAARKKQIETVQPTEAQPHTEVVSYELPPPKSECKYVDAENPEQLIDLLHNEAKVI